MRIMIPLFALMVMADAYSQTPTAQDTLKHVNAIAGQLIAPCCWSQTADAHQSDASKKIKEEIGSAILAGKTDAQIIQQFVDQYGERILAVPRPKGFNVTLWFLVVAAAVVSGLSLLLYLLRVSRQGKATATSAIPVDDSMQERIQTELGELDR